MAKARHYPRRDGQGVQQTDGKSSPHVAEDNFLCKIKREYCQAHKIMSVRQNTCVLSLPAGAIRR